MNPIGWAKGLAFKTAARAKKNIEKRRGDTVLLQLRELEKAYSGATGPDILFLVDSMSVYVGKQDTDRRGLCQMVLDELPAGTTACTIAGPAYTSELNLAFLGALERCRSRPKIVVVPTHFASNCGVFLNHPRVGYRVATDMINEAVASGQRPRHLRPTPPELVEAYDATVAPTVSGRYRTWGEMRMAVDSRPETKAQAMARKACLFDCYWGDKLEPGAPGLEWTRRLAAEIHRMGMVPVGIQLPIDHELTERLLGVSPVEQSVANAALTTASFRSGADDAVTIDTLLVCGADDFCDPLHVNDRGRHKLVPRIAPVMAAIVAGDLEKAQHLADEQLQQVSPPSITST